jgi:4-hydroxy 2-oxovalerate aldolase
VIVTSNVERRAEEQFEGQVFCINYKEWTKLEHGTNDSAMVVMFNVLRALGVKEVYLAGFDGFSASINENYMDPNLRRPVTDEQAKERNAFFRGYVKRMRKCMEITFVTESKYD